MKKKSQRLDLVRSLRAREEEAASLILARQSAALKEQQDRLHDLERYRDEYLSAGVAGSAAQSPVNRGAFHTFMGQISSAIEQQLLVIESLERQVAQAQQNYVHSHHRTTVMSNLVDREKEHERIQFDKREEANMNDEFTSRRSFEKNK